ncbi:hypothetical protein [Kaarinaea lacus]
MTSASLKVTVFIVVIVTYTLATNVFATSIQTGDALIAETQPSANAGSQSDTGGLLSEIQQMMPHLEQALIIFTSFNGILIVFGAAAYLLRKRLDSQSVSTLASIRATQSPLHKTKSDPT